MGKDSLVKSTSKKKAAAKKKEEEKKLAAAKKAAPKAKAAAKAKPKAAPKAKAKPKAAPKAKAKPKAAPKAKAKPKAAREAKKAPAVKGKKTAPEPKKKAVSVKDLIHKKFEPWKPEKIYSAGPDKAFLKDFVAPPYVSGTMEEQQRVKALLLKKHDLPAIEAVPEKVEVEKAAAEKTVEPEVPADF